MGNPALVEVTRGDRVESRHTGAVAVADSAGGLVWSAGDVAQPVYPRSAIKAMQALVLVESGAADRFGFGDRELALACASHGGEPGHVETAAGMLARAGLDEGALKCGAHWPIHQPSALALALACSGAQAGALHNNCSGKHAGFVCAACAMNANVARYVEPSHAVQREVKAALENLTGAMAGEPAIDGCSVPTWAVPLAALARGFARFATGDGVAPQRAKAATRLRAACAREPWYVAGSGRFCTEVMGAFGPRVFVKTGAEGVFCGALPELGLGIAVKCDDGATRAAETMMAATLARFLTSATDRAALAPRLAPTLRNWNGTPVGTLRVAGPLAEP